MTPPTPAAHAPAPQARVPETGNLPLLLNEIGHALDRLLADGTPSVIDLTSLPLAPQEAEGLEAALGTGEITATFSARGDSEVRETSFPGVWRVTHFSEAGTPVARLVEITHVPALLAADDGDIAAGRRRLARHIELMRKTEGRP